MICRIDWAAGVGEGRARAGGGVVIGSEKYVLVFDWEPSVMAGAQMPGRQGRENRFGAWRTAAQWRHRDRQAERDEETREFDDFVSGAARSWGAIHG